MATTQTRPLEIHVQVTCRRDGVSPIGRRHIWAVPDLVAMREPTGAMLHGATKLMDEIARELPPEAALEVQVVCCLGDPDADVYRPHERVIVGAEFVTVGERFGALPAIRAVMKRALVAAGVERE